MDCRILSTGRFERYEGVRSVTLPVASGEVEILPGHAEAFLRLSSGGLTIRTEKGEEKKHIVGGGCRVTGEEVIVFLNVIQ